MIIPDKKKTVSVILGKLGKDGMGTPVKPESDMGSPDAGLRSAAEELMMAIKGDSVDHLMSAMKAFIAEADLAEDASEGENSEMPVV